MPATFWYYQCLNSECALKEAVVVSVRTNVTIPNPDLPCPLCREPMKWDASEEADADGYPKRGH